jgi:PAS domain-containing protein
LTCMQDATLATALITYAPDAIILTDCVGGIRLWNLGAEAPFGHSAAEAVGHTFNLSVPELSRTAHWAGFARAVQPAASRKTPGYRRALHSRNILVERTAQCAGFVVVPGFGSCGPQLTRSVRPLPVLNNSPSDL